MTKHFLLSHSVRFPATLLFADEVDTLSNGAHCYPQLLDPNVRQGAACWGFTGTVIRNSWQDARRSLAFVTGDTAWEQASEEAVKAEVRLLADSRRTRTASWHRMNVSVQRMHQFAASCS